MTVREALSALPRVGEPGNDARCTARIVPAQRPVMRPSPYRGALLFNGSGRPLRRVPSRLRRITVQEAAALQTFPAAWVFQGPQAAQYRQIGNAVPPKLAEAVAMAVRDHLTAAASSETGDHLVLPRHGQRILAA